jgi:hypothetical protein
VKDIDFLPRQYREEHAQRRNQIWRFGVVAIYAALLAVASYSQWLEKKRFAAQLAATTEQHAAVTEQAKKLAELQNELQTVRSQAELITYLRHPWPRTQILAAVIEPLTPEITLNELRVYRADAAPVLGGPLRDRNRANALAEGQEDKRTPAQRDLAGFQDTIDAANVVVVLKGTTRDNAALHIYLGELGRARLFAKVELLAIESSEANPGGTSRFGARLTVRAGYGQRSGPTPTETTLSQNP